MHTLKPNASMRGFDSRCSRPDLSTRGEAVRVVVVIIAVLLLAYLIYEVRKASSHDTGTTDDDWPEDMY